MIINTKNVIETKLCIEPASSERMPMRARSILVTTSGTVQLKYIPEGCLIVKVAAKVATSRPERNKPALKIKAVE